LILIGFVNEIQIRACQASEIYREDSRFLECGTALLDEWFPVSLTTMVSPSLTVKRSVNNDLFVDPLTLESESAAFLQNVGNDLPNIAVLHTRRPEPSLHSCTNLKRSYLRLS
jgi:hypothetical protein